MVSDGDHGPRETFRVEVGRVHGVKPGNLVGAIVNEIGLDPNQIGHIRIEHDYSTVDLPSGMSRDVFKVIGRAWVLGRQLRISKLSDHPDFSQRSNFEGNPKGNYPRRPRPDGASYKDKRPKDRRR
jgi:ATP-dependent RNA helicase DeaD